MKFNADILNEYWKKDNIGIKEITSFLNVSHNTASEHVKRIIDKKYLIKKRDKIDERKVILELTPLGREVLYRNSSLDRAKLNEILKGMSTEEKELLESALRLLKERAKNVHSC
jgi:MarR family transcriptional regulator, organic hydroperoxide resistance regulator